MKRQSLAVSARQALKPPGATCCKGCPPLLGKFRHPNRPPIIIETHQTPVECCIPQGRKQQPVFRVQPLVFAATFTPGNNVRGSQHPAIADSRHRAAIVPPEQQFPPKTALPNTRQNPLFNLCANRIVNISPVGGRRSQSIAAGTIKKHNPMVAQFLQHPAHGLGQGSALGADLPNDLRKFLVDELVAGEATARPLRLPLNRAPQCFPPGHARWLEHVPIWWNRQHRKPMRKNRTIERLF